MKGITRNMMKGDPRVCGIGVYDNCPDWRSVTQRTVMMKMAITVPSTAGPHF